MCLETSQNVKHRLFFIYPNPQKKKQYHVNTLIFEPLPSKRKEEMRNNHSVFDMPLTTIKNKTVFEMFLQS